MHGRILALVAAVLLAACTKNTIAERYALPVADAYAQLLALDPLSTSSEVRYCTAATSVKVESVPDTQVTWRIMVGDDELYRYVAELSPDGAATTVALKLDVSHAPEAPVNPALAETTARLDKGRRLSVMAEKIAATLEHRSFEAMRVEARLKEFGTDDKAAQAEMLTKTPAMASSALGQYADMKRQMAELEAADAASTAAAPRSDRYASDRGQSSRPMNVAEMAAERQRNR